MSAWLLVITCIPYCYQLISFELLLFCYVAQVGLLGIQLIWTRDVTEALRKSETDQKVTSKTEQQILNLLNSVLGRVTVNASAVDRIKFESIATLQIYYKETFNDLVSWCQYVYVFF